MSGIVVLGPVFVDVKGYPYDKYIPAGRNSGRVEFVHGGVSRNIAENIARVGLGPTFVSLADETGTGEDVISRLDKSGVNTKYIRKVRDGMGTWLAVFDNSGDVVASISKRPDLSEICRILDEEGDSIFRDCRGISVEIDMDESIVSRVFSYAEKHGKKVFAVVSNMSIAVQRREYIKKTECFVCNLQEAGIFFSEDYSGLTPEQMSMVLAGRISDASLNSMVVTMGEDGAVWALRDGSFGICPAVPVDVKDTTGAGDAFFSGVCMGRCYGLDLDRACAAGARLAATVIHTVENVCPRFEPAEFGLEI